MKKLAALLFFSTFLIVLMVASPQTSFAWQGGLLQGTLPTAYSAPGSIVLSRLTDNSLSATATGSSYKNHYYEYTLSKPTRLTGIYIYSNRLPFTVTFYDENKTSLFSTSLTVSGKTTVDPVNNVKYVRFTQTINSYAQLYELDVYEGAPDTPTIQAVATSGEVALTWDQTGGADSYNVYRDGTKIASAITAYNYTVTGLENNITYSWQVSASNTSGESAKSTAVETYFDSRPPPPSNLNASATASQVSLTWDLVAGATFNIYKNGVKVTATSITATTYTVTGTTANMLYTWGVTSVSGGYESEKTSVTTLYDSEPPSAPTGLFATAIAAGGQVKLEWVANAASDKVTGYNIYQDGSLIATVATTTKNVTVTPLESHTYTVTAFDTAGNESEPSASIEAAALAYPDVTPPAAPQNVTANGLEGKVQLSWRANTETDIAGYRIYQNGALISNTLITSNAYYVVGGMVWGTVYRFQIAAVDTSGNESEKSNIATAAATQPTDTTPPDKLTGLKASISSDASNILLSWDSNDDDDLGGYYVYVSSDNLAFNRVNAALLVDPNYAYGYSTGNTLFYFRVTAVDEYGNESTPSKSVQIRTPSRDPNESTEETKPSLIVSWESITGAISYLVYYNGTLVASVSSSTLQYEITAEQGYDPASTNQNVNVKARFLDGSIGSDGDAAGSGKWGFTVSDIWDSSLYIVGSMAAFLLLGIVVALSPKLIKLIRTFVLKRRATP